MNKPWKFFKIW